MRGPGDDYLIAPADRNSSLYQIRPFRVFYGAFVNEVPTIFDHNLLADAEIKNMDGTDGAAPAANTIPPLTATAAGNDADSGESYATMLTNAVDICVRASTFERWRGNIWRRITYFTRAR